MRGEHLSEEEAAEAALGSSPRARGTPFERDNPEVDVRVIPACAGNTNHHLPYSVNHPGHPRVRGEHGEVGQHGQRHRRVIPACAGNTPGFFFAAPLPSGHPRVRGEHLVVFLALSLLFGSSPRARGTQPREALDPRSLRVIPACAGNTMRCCRYTPARPGHPRVRGEHAGDMRLGMYLRGSSPRARGTPHHAPGVTHGNRVIPACAGNTQRNRSAPSASAGHPRVRGEHVQPGGTGVGLGRVIPACAGNTATGAPSRSRSTGHPRVRGEHSGGVADPLRGAGSSPRARGTRKRVHGPYSVQRVIPACAGNTSPAIPNPGGRPGHPRVRGEH